MQPIKHWRILTCWLFSCAMFYCISFPLVYVPLDHLNERSAVFAGSQLQHMWVNALPVTTISKVTAPDNDIHHSVSLAPSFDLLHIMLSNVSGARLLGGMMINRGVRESCERRCWRGLQNKPSIQHSAACHKSEKNNNKWTGPGQESSIII